MPVFRGRFTCLISSWVIMEGEKEEENYKNT